jgi:hypothetical protein
MKKRINTRKTIRIVLLFLTFASMVWIWAYSTNLTRVCRWGQKPILMLCRETDTGGYHCDGLGYTVDSIKYNKGKGFNDYYQLGGWTQIRLFGKVMLEAGG